MNVTYNLTHFLPLALEGLFFGCSKPRPIPERCNTPSELDWNRFRDCVIGLDRPSLVIIGADWCPGCVELEKRLQKIWPRWKQKAALYKVKLPNGRSPENSLDSYFFSKYGVTSIPAAILFRGASILGRYDPKEQDNDDATLREVEKLLEKRLR